MSSSEIVGMCLTVGLLGGSLGVVAGVLLGRRRSEAQSLLFEQRRAIARWAAARRTLGRASASFVAAFRSLAAEDRASAAYALREQEAQRARATWFECCREIDQAEAALLAAGLGAPASPQPAEAPTDPRALRAAIEGSAEEAATFLARLKEADRIVDATMLERFKACAAATGPARIAGALVRCLEALADRWSRRP